MKEAKFSKFSKEAKDKKGTKTPKTPKNSLFPFYRGLVDGLNIFSTFSLINRSSRIKKFLTKVIPFYLIFGIVNILYYEWYFCPGNSSYTVTGAWWICWLVPAYMFVCVVHYMRFGELWKSVYENKKKFKDMTKGLEYVSELVYGIMLVTVYAIQTILIDYIVPTEILSAIFSTISFAWGISWSVFEYRMIYEGHSLSQRIKYFERRWIYFLGFGLPLAILHRNLSWGVALALWYPMITLLSLRVILATPIKSPEKPQKTLGIFTFAEYISTQIVNSVVNKWGFS